MSKQIAAENLAQSVLDWWENHKYDVVVDDGYSEEYNRYNEVPHFVKLAALFLNKEIT